jgi:hypothetical protein
MGPVLCPAPAVAVREKCRVKAPIFFFFRINKMLKTPLFSLVPLLVSAFLCFPEKGGFKIKANQSLPFL